MTHSIIISNTGSKPIKNVRLGHNILPENIDIYPSINYKIVEMNDKSKEIIFLKLVRREIVTISYLYFPPLTFKNINTYIKSDSGYAKEIDTILSKNIQNGYFL